MLSVSVRQIEYVVAVAEHGGITAAAQALYVSQPALSVAISVLERNLGKTLFIRSKGCAVVPTSFGRNFLKQSDHILQALQKLVYPDAVNSGQYPPIVIGCFEDLAPIVIGRLQACMKLYYPTLVFTTHIGGFEFLYNEMTSGQIDFAITYDLGLDASIARRAITEVQPYALFNAEHTLAGQTSVSLAQLTQEPLILSDQGLSVRHMLDLFKHCEVTPTIAQHAGSFEIMRSLVANDLGVGLAYTRPHSKTSYDGLEIKTLAISDELDAVPIVIASNRLNTPLPGDLMNDIVCLVDGVISVR